MAVIGIDLGTTNSLAAVWKDGKSVLIPNGLGACLTPSVVTEAEGAVWVGTVAREKRLVYPRQSAASFKRLMGTDQKLYLGDKPFHLKPCQKSCLSGGIALFIIKICRDADHGLVYGLPQKFLRVLL